MIDRIKFGKALKQRRTDEELTQAELAKKAGVSTVTVQLIEKGKGNPRISTLDMISYALDALVDLNIKSRNNDY